MYMIGVTAVFQIYRDLNLDQNSYVLNVMHIDNVSLHFTYTDISRCDTSRGLGLRVFY